MLASHHRADRYVPHLPAGLRSAVWIIFEGEMAQWSEHGRSFVRRV